MATSDEINNVFKRCWSEVRRPRKFDCSSGGWISSSLQQTTGRASIEDALPGQSLKFKNKCEESRLNNETYR